MYPPASMGSVYAARSASRQPPQRDVHRDHGCKRRPCRAERPAQGRCRDIRAQDGQRLPHRGARRQHGRRSETAPASGRALTVPAPRREERGRGHRQAGPRSTQDRGRASRSRGRQGQDQEEEQGQAPRSRTLSRSAHASNSTAPRPCGFTCPNPAKGQVTRNVTWPWVEPPVGFEPTTYALQVRCSGHLS